MISELTRRRALALLGGLMAAPSRACAAPESTAGVCPVLRRGLNFHHVLNWPETRTVGGQLDYVWPPFGAENYRLRDDDLRRVKQLGFDFIRLTADPSILLTAQGERWAYLRDYIQRAVRQIAAAGFKVVFDLHPVNVNPAYKPELLVKSGSSPLFAAYVGMVARVAEALRDFPPDLLVFELMNEPWMESLSQAPRWQTMLETLHASARSAAPNLPLMLSGLMWSDRAALMKLDVAPFRGSNVLYTFHYYDPHTFTHQGVKGDDAQYISGLGWPATGEMAAQVKERAAAAIAAQGGLDPAGKAAAVRRTGQLLDHLLAGRYDGSKIRRDFVEVAQWARGNAIPAWRVVLGEFGCVIASRGQPLGPSRLDWLKSVREAAEAVGFPWAYWAFKGYGGMELADSAGNIHGDLLAPLGLAG